MSSQSTCCDIIPRINGRYAFSDGYCGGAGRSAMPRRGDIVSASSRCFESSLIEPPYFNTGPSIPSCLNVTCTATAAYRVTAASECTNILLRSVLSLATTHSLTYLPLCGEQMEPMPRARQRVRC